MGRTEPGLGGAAILLTRPPERVTALADRLRRRGATVDARPTIRLGPPADPEPARQAVRGLARYDWLVFTSPTGVRFFFEEVLRSGTSPALRARFAAVGPGTAAALRDLAQPVQVVATESRAEGLGRALAAALRPGERILLVRPEATSVALAAALGAAGAEVDAVTFYRNEPAPDTGPVARDLADGRYDLAVFSSPSSLERLLDCGAVPREELLAALDAVALVALGPVTAQALAASGLRARAVAAEPTDDGIIAAIERGLGLAL